MNRPEKPSFDTLDEKWREYIKYLEKNQKNKVPIIPANFVTERSDRIAGTHEKTQDSAS